MKQQIGIIGTGNVGKTLAAGFLRHGYHVMIGSRSAEKLQAVQRGIGEPLAIGTLNEVARFAEIVILAVKGTGALEAIAMIESEQLANKVIIDTTNPIAEAPPINGVFQYFTQSNESLMEQMQRATPNARFVKAWNSVGSLHMVDPKFPGGRPTMFICGNDLDAKHLVSDILNEFGWDAEDMGQMESARAIEQLGRLWCIHYLRSNQRNHVFKLLKQ
jgi:predicted dinucleotide-binding enzyme